MAAAKLTASTSHCSFASICFQDYQIKTVNKNICIINLPKCWKAITFFQKGNNDLVSHVARAEMLSCLFSIKNVGFFYTMTYSLPLEN